jgi:isopenicillin N synthase-like dioxygenase
MSNIPSVDLSNFLSSNNELKRDFVKKTGKAFHEIGFLSLKGHFFIEKLFRKSI